MHFIHRHLQCAECLGKCSSSNGEAAWIDQHGIALRRLQGLNCDGFVIGLDNLNLDTQIRRRLSDSCIDFIQRFRPEYLHHGVTALVQARALNDEYVDVLSPHR